MRRPPRPRAEETGIASRFLFMAIAFFVTGGLATSRALTAKLTPPAMLNEFFGLYAMPGTFTTFLAPAAIGVLTALLHDNRAGAAVGFVFLVVGLS